MGGWDVLAGALAGGATGYINSRIDDYEKQEAQIRKESELRLRQQFDQENLDQRHKFAIDEADYRNRQANTRDETRYNRELGLAKLRDKNAMERLDWQAKHRPEKIGNIRQKFNDLSSIYGEEQAKKMLAQGMAGTQRVGPQTIFDLSPKDRSKMLSDGMKAYDSLTFPPMIKGPDGKDVQMSAEQWVEQVYFPKIFQQEKSAGGALPGPKDKPVADVNDKVLVDATKRLSALPPDEQYVALQKISQKLGKPNAERVAMMLSYTNDRNKNKKFVKDESKNVDPLVDYYEGLPPGQPGRSGLKYYQDSPLKGALSGLFKRVDGPTGMEARGRR